MAQAKLKQPTETKADAQPQKPGMEVVTDSKGRKLTVNTDLDVLYESRLMLAIGPQAAANAAYLTCFVYPAAYVTEIDGVPQDPPMTVREIEARLKVLGREGLAAVMGVLVREGEAAKKKLEQEEALKN